jgi:hypothetical protein
MLNKRGEKASGTFFTAADFEAMLVIREGNS